MALAPRSAVVPVTLLCLLASGLTVPAVAGPAHARAAHRHADTSTVTLAPGVTLQHVSMRSDNAPEQVTLLGVDLTRADIDATSPNGEVGDARASVRTQINARHAIGGVNADFFNLNRQNASPRGTLVASGRMLKSPAAPRNADLVIRRATHGLVASVGPVPFGGRVVRVRPGQRNRGRSLTTVNSLVSARAGGLTLLTSAMAPSTLTRACTLATGTIVRGTWSVQTVRSTYSTPALTASTWGLLSCAGNGQQWIRTSLRRGDRIKVADAITGGTPWAAVSGGSVLVRNGKAWHDPLGERLPYRGRNAETFACVTKSGRGVLLGTVDGYSDRSAGVTYRELTSYLLTLRGCYSGVVLDGGGSSTLVAKLPGAGRATVQNVPADHPARPVADTLVVLAG